VPREDEFGKGLRKLYPGYSKNLIKPLFSNWPKVPFIMTVTPHRRKTRSSPSERSSTSRSTAGCSSREIIRGWTSSAIWRVLCAQVKARPIN